MYSHLNVKTLGIIGCSFKKKKEEYDGITVAREITTSKMHRHILGSVWPNKQLDIYGLLMGSLLNVSNSMNNCKIFFLCFSEKMTLHLFWTTPSA